jgi:class 3 adenylate cyclase
VNLRQSILRALRRNPYLIPKLTDSLKQRADDDESILGTFVQAASALEPILAEAVDKRPSRIGALGLKSAHLLAGLTMEDEASNTRLAAIARNSTVGIVFVDVADFTSFTAANGDDVAVSLLNRLDAIIRRAVKPAKGEVVKSLGDGFLIAFPSASQAVRGAVAIRNTVANERAKDEVFSLVLRIAVHSGEPLVEQDDLLGHDVNLTARLLDHCRPGEVIVSDAARALAQRRLKSVVFEAPRDVKIRGLATPVRAFSLRP